MFFILKLTVVLLAALLCTLYTSTSDTQFLLLTELMWINLFVLATLSASYVGDTSIYGLSLITFVFAASELVVFSVLLIFNKS